LRIVVAKGKKEKLQAHAANNGKSLNGFVTRAINEALERDILKGAADKTV
jgi:predicted HicB family RNase H-like nuclease